MDKRNSAARAVSCIRDGQTVMVGGFGLPGTPLTLIDALLEHGARDLTLIKNEANEPGLGVSRLIEAGRVRTMVLSHLGLNGTVIDMMNRGEVEVRFFPQGILAEKIRAGGAGLPGFLTDIGVDTILKDNKQTIVFEGREVIVEPSLRADVALVHACCADRYGNLAYEKTARNFNPLMAMASDHVIAEAVKVTEPGGMDPDCVHTPAAFVDCVVDLGGTLGEAYKVLEHHVLET